MQRADEQLALELLIVPSLNKLLCDIRSAIFRPLYKKKNKNPRLKKKPSRHLRGKIAFDKGREWGANL